MSFDKFLLTVESRDLSQDVKSNIRVSSFPKLSVLVCLLKDTKQNMTLGGSNPNG